MAETLLTPAEASRALDATSEAWHVLQNAALGRGAVPRSDVPSKVQDAIVTDAAAYQKWVDSLGLWDALTNDYGAELSMWRRRYALDRSALIKALPTASVPQLEPTRGLGEAIAQEVEAAAAGGLLLAALALGGFWLWSRRKKEQAA